MFHFQEKILRSFFITWNTKHFQFAIQINSCATKFMSDISDYEIVFSDHEDLEQRILKTRKQSNA